MPLIAERSRRASAARARGAILAAILFSVGTAFGCASAGRGAAEVALLPSAEMAEILERVEALWKAARAGDSVSLRQLSVGDTALIWAKRWHSAYPSFFDSTASRLTATYGYFADSSRRIAVLEFEAPWVTCQRPVYAGKNDHYFVRGERDSNSWRIWRVWSEPC